MRFLRRRPLVSAFVVTMVSLGAVVCAVIMADFGATLWMFAPVLLWLGTLGLPSTMGVLMVAMIWGSIPVLSGIGPFAIVAAIVALAFQAGAFVAASKIARMRVR